jgi:hemoglobin-like flavoprotein
MTPERIKLIKLSFAPIIARKREVGQLFYQRLFETAPDLRAMFKTDMNAQAEKLMSTLGAMVGCLQDRPALDAMFENLGRKHVGYGVKDEHYDKIGATLLWTLEKMLGDAFTDEAKRAWTELYDMVASMMRESAGKTGLSAERTLRTGTL